MGQVMVNIMVHLLTYEPRSIAVIKAIIDAAKYQCGCCGHCAILSAPYNAVAVARKA